MKKYLVLFFAVFMMGTTYADEAHQQIPVPGFRPEPEGNAEQLFREKLGSMEITVFPTVARSFTWTKHDESSREAICTFIKNNNIAKPLSSDQKIDLSTSTSSIQWEVFNKGISLFADHLKANPVQTEYALLVELLIAPKPSGGEFIGGIQCYILDSSGRNVFSLLLNSHHALFTNAQLKTDDATEESKAALIQKGTNVMLEALRGQLDLKEIK